jgi:hypothetical protein
LGTGFIAGEIVMDEKEWLECTDPQKMLEFLKGTMSARKLRLFACACCRRIWPWFRDRRCQHAVETAEKYADGLVPFAEISIARDAAIAAFQEEEIQLYEEKAMTPAYVNPAFDAAADAANAQNTAYTAAYRAAIHAAEAVVFPSHDTHDYLSYLEYGAPIRPVEASSDDESEASANTASLAAIRTEQAAQAGLLHDIFGTHFRSIRLDPTWLTSTVRALAHAIYEERNFTDLPVLADALEEAGCYSQDILSHLRGPGEHTRGCWVLDLVLGKE